MYFPKVLLISAASFMAMTSVAAASDTLKYREVADIVDEYLEARGLGNEDVQLSQRGLRNKLLFAGFLGAVGYGVHEHGKKKEAEEKNEKDNEKDEKKD